MGSGFRRFAKGIFITITILAAILVLLGSFASYLNPEKWWFMPLLSLGFPLVLLLNLFFLFFWLIIKTRYTLIPLIALLIGWKNASRLLAVNTHNTFSYTQKKESLRIVSWNVARFVEMKRNDNKGSRQRLEMMAMLKKQNADVLCLQEFFTSISPDYYNNIRYIQKELNYPSFYFSYESDGYGHWYSSVIFTRLPVIDTGKTYYPGPGIKEVLLHADLKFNDDTIRIFNTHLQSALFGKADYDKIEKIQHGDEGVVQNSRSIFYKLKTAAAARSRQARLAAEQVKISPYPVIFAGDLNDVPGSYTYTQIRGNMQDAFLEKGFGIGRTFSSLSPTLRIDYIFADKSFLIQQFNRYPKKLSDHYMIVADIVPQKGVPAN